MSYLILCGVNLLHDNPRGLTRFFLFHYLFTASGSQLILQTEFKSSKWNKCKSNPNSFCIL